MFALKDMLTAAHVYVLAYLHGREQKVNRKRDDTEGGCARATLKFQLLILWHVSTCFAPAASLIIFSSSPSSD